MGSTGQAIGSAVGAVVGTIIAPGVGTLYGASIGYSLGGLIDPPQIKVDGPDGPKVEDIQGPTFQHNVPVPIVYGTYPLMGNVMFIGEAKSHLVRTDVHVVEGGKAGRTRTDVNERWYDLDFALGLCEGPIQSFVKVYKNQKDITHREGARFDTHLGLATAVVSDEVINASLEDGDVPWRYTAHLMWNATIGPLNSLPHLEVWVEGLDTTVEESASNSLVL
jgi:hypothetical protein